MRKKRRRRSEDRIEPFSFEKSSLFKSPFFWMVLVIFLSLGIFVYHQGFV